MYVRVLVWQNQSNNPLFKSLKFNKFLTVATLKFLITYVKKSLRSSLNFEEVFIQKKEIHWAVRLILSDQVTCTHLM